jgi:hypothetical protein
MEEALSVMLPVLEEAPDAPPEAGLKLVQAYLRRCKEADRESNAELIQRVHKVLTGPAPSADEPE